MCLRAPCPLGRGSWFWGAQDLLWVNASGGMSPRSTQGWTSSHGGINRLDYVFVLHSSFQECVVFSVGACVRCAAKEFSIGNIGSIEDDLTNVLFNWPQPNFLLVFDAESGFGKKCCCFSLSPPI